MSTSHHAHVADLMICCFSNDTRWYKRIDTLLDVWEPWYYHTHFQNLCLEESLIDADWKRVRNTFAPTVPKGYRVYKALLPGVLNLVNIAKLPKGSILNVVTHERVIDWSEPVQVCRYLQTTGGYHGEIVDTTYLATRIEDGREMFADIFIGRPIPTRKYHVDCRLGCRESVTREEALSAGYEWALADMAILLPEEERERLQKEEGEYVDSYFPDIFHEFSDY